MKSKLLRKLFFGVTIGLLLLAGMLWLPAHAARTQTLSESEREQAAALAAEQGTRPYRAIAPTIPAGVAPLFVGVDSLTIPAYTIDVETNTFYTAFVGLETWGATYDPDLERVLIMDGTQLWEWPVSGSPNFLGAITYQGDPFTLPGLAYFNGVLYGAHTIGTEGIYTVDLTTLVASPFITYTATANTVDIGGIEFDPASGLLYGANDGSAQQGLVQINANGTLTLVTPYLGGETDVDGLTIHDGLAYLITDDPSPAYFTVYDLVAGNYTDTVANPWTTDELFAGGAWIGGEVLTPTIYVFPSTIARDVLTEATVEDYLVVSNIGTGFLNWQVVENDTAVTTLNTGGCTPNDIPWVSVTPTTGIAFAGEQDAVTVTLAATGYAPGVYTGTLCVESNDPIQPLVRIPLTMTVMGLPTAGIVLTKTVGTETGVCATTTAITVTEGTAVNYCYEIANTGGVTLPLHSLQDSALGNLLVDYPYDLAPGQSTQVQFTTTLTTSVSNTATWTAFTPPSVTAADPLSDTIGEFTPQHDINQVSLATDGETVTVTVSFTGPISPADSGSPYALGGSLNLDFDQNQSTGGQSPSSFFCLHSGSLLGVDFNLGLGSYSSTNGQAQLRDYMGNLVGLVAVTFTADSFTAVIPTALLNNDDGAVRLAGVLGTLAEPTDCVPNSGFLSSEVVTAVATATATATVTPLPPPPTYALYLPIILKP